MAYAGSSPSAVIPLVGSQLTYQLGGGVVSPPDIGPGWQRGRHQQFMGAPGEIPPHAISCDKGQEEYQHQQNGWQRVKQSSSAGSGNEGGDLHVVTHRSVSL